MCLFLANSSSHFCQEMKTDLKKLKAPSLLDIMLLWSAEKRTWSSTEAYFHGFLWPWLRFAINVSIGPIASTSASEGNPPPLQCRCRYMASNTALPPSSEIISSTE